MNVPLSGDLKRMVVWGIGQQDGGTQSDDRPASQAHAPRARSHAEADGGAIGHFDQLSQPD